jgi:ATP-binding cassette, subfamily B, beta-glucan exporter
MRYLDAALSGKKLCRRPGKLKPPPGSNVQKAHPGRKKQWLKLILTIKAERKGLRNRRTAHGMIGIFNAYRRALAMLRSEFWLAVFLVMANVGVAVLQLAEPVLFGRVVDALARGYEAFPLIGLWAFLGFLSVVVSVFLAVWADRLAHRQRLAAMTSAFDRAITLPISYHAERGSGRVVRTMLAGTDALFALWLTFLREHLAAIVSIALLIPTAMAIDWRLTLILLVLAVVYSVVNLFVIRRTESGQSNVERYHQDVFGRVGDVIGNVSVVQSYARLRDEQQALRDLTQQLLSAQYPVLTWWAMLTVFTRAAATISMVAVFAVGALLASRGEVTVGEIVSFVGFANLLIGKLDQLSGFVANIFTRVPTLNAFYDLLDASGSITEKPGASGLTDVKGAVAYDNVTFRFGKSNVGVFDLDFRAAPGETIALVGATGSGKTTTLALLQRLRDPDHGRITVDDVDIRDVTLTSLRHYVAVVFQEVGLFNRSIYENIHIGRLDATFEEVEAAAQMAEAHDFIMAKPGGYNFVIGERGSALSGGERQRIGIARAILKNAPILILDEATSALDNETEARIQRAFDAVRAGRTTFIIAHRLSTIANADRILVFRSGRIVEAGRYEDLVALGGVFASLVRAGAPQPTPEPAL